MNRSTYFEFIESKLTSLAASIDMRGGLNILNLNLHAENFYLHFCNLLFGWELHNLNAVDQNAAGIDLVDTKNRVVVQVSATATKQKIESALAKDLSLYSGYGFRFISISKDAKGLRDKTFANPHNLKFLPTSDILDVRSLLRHINGLDVDGMKEICSFLRKELSSEPAAEKVESNLTAIIIVLAKENWGQGVMGIEIMPYDVSAKLSYNDLVTARALVDEFKIHYHRIDKIYSAFDNQGMNKSISILNGIRSEYLAIRDQGSPDKQFFMVIERVIARIHESANYLSMPREELELCVQVLVVDAFIRCKIFANPLGGPDAHS